MSSRVRFVLNRQAFRQEIFKGEGTVNMLESIAKSAAPSNAEVVVDEVASRGRARIYGSTSDEAAKGSLSRAIGLMRI